MAGHLTQGSRNIDMPEEKKGSMEDRTADSEGQLYWRPLFFLHGENHQGGSQEEQGPWEISYTKMGATKRHHGTGRLPSVNFLSGPSPASRGLTPQHVARTQVSQGHGLWELARRQLTGLETE